MVWIWSHLHHLNGSCEHLSVFGFNMEKYRKILPLSLTKKTYLCFQIPPVPQNCTECIKQNKNKSQKSAGLRPAPILSCLPVPPRWNRVKKSIYFKTGNFILNGPLMRENIMFFSCLILKQIFNVQETSTTIFCFEAY